MPTCDLDEYTNTTEHCNLHPPACPEGCTSHGTETPYTFNGEIKKALVCHCNSCGETGIALCKNGYCIGCHKDDLTNMDVED